MKYRKCSNKEKWQAALFQDQIDLTKNLLIFVIGKTLSKIVNRDFNKIYMKNPCMEI